MGELGFPYFMLECCFNDHTYTLGYNEVNRLKEDVIETPVDIRPKRGMGAAQSMDIAFFEFVAAERGAAYVLCQGMSKRGFS
jgi:hypothetical protein